MKGILLDYMSYRISLGTVGRVSARDIKSICFFFSEKFEKFHGLFISVDDNASLLITLACLILKYASCWCRKLCQQALIITLKSS